jgi:hypothetical protein
MCILGVGHMQQNARRSNFFVGCVKHQQQRPRRVSRNQETSFGWVKTNAFIRVLLDAGFNALFDLCFPVACLGGGGGGSGSSGGGACWTMCRRLLRSTGHDDDDS